MPLRSPRERIIQTLSYEAGGLALALPLYLLYTGGGASEGALVMVAMSAAVLLWSPLHNSVFDWADLRLSGRVASDRPQKWRMVHALCHEATTMVVTLPVLIWLGGHGLWEAVGVDIGLTLVYAVYAYLFHMAYDWLRPVRRFPGPAFAS